MKPRFCGIRHVMLAVMFLVFAVAAQAAVLDQNNPPLNVGLNDSLEWQQQVTAGLGGTLAGITLYVNAGSDTDLVQIGVGPGYFTGTYSFSATVTILASGTFIDTSAAGIHLNPGDPFVIDVTGGPGCCNLAGSINAYPGGDLYLNVGGNVEDYTQLFGYSMAFQTYMNTIPEPGSLLLLGSGVAGLAGLLRRKVGL